MSNQRIDGFQGSQPFVTEDNDKYNRLTEEGLKLIYLYEKQKLKKNYTKFSKKQKLIKDSQKLKKFNEKIDKGIDIKKPKKPKTKIKTFEDYFEECIKNKKIPLDTPSYFRKALERAIKEHEQGIIVKNHLWKILLISMLLKEILVPQHLITLKIFLKD